MAQCVSHTHRHTPAGKAANKLSKCFIPEFKNEPVAVRAKANEVILITIIIIKDNDNHNSCGCVWSRLLMFLGGLTSPAVIFVHFRGGSRISLIKQKLWAALIKYLSSFSRCSSSRETHTSGKPGKIFLCRQRKVNETLQTCWRWRRRWRRARLESRRQQAPGSVL